MNIIEAKCYACMKRPAVTVIRGTSICAECWARQNAPPPTWLLVASLVFAALFATQCGLDIAYGDQCSRITGVFPWCKL